MLPGVGIFGSDPISKVLIQLLRHFEFEIHGIWTNHYEIDSASFISNETSSEFPKLITTSIDNVLLNKNVNLVFVCCQPNLHSQICSKALGIGKNVICLFPTCKDLDSINSMINSAKYYPSLMSSINYGGLRFLSEFKLIKQYMSYIGDIKLCNIVINCQNIAINRQNSKFLIDKHGSLSSLIDNINFVASASTSPTSLNWLSDRDLGAGCLNRFGAAIISLMLHLFEDRKVTKVYGSLKTFVEDFETSCDLTDRKFIPYRQSSMERTKSDINNNNKVINSPVPNSIRKLNLKKSQIRKITADDHCTFQMRLEPKNETVNKKFKNSIMVTVVINSLAQCKYSQEILLCGNEGAIEWKNSKLLIRSNSPTNKLKETIKLISNSKELIDANNNDLSNDSNDFLETELLSTDPIDVSAELFLKQFKNLEYKYPELPLIFIKGLYYYLQNVKNSFLDKDASSTSNLFKNNLENFEHTHLVQSIIKNIALSNECNRWVPVNY